MLIKCRETSSSLVSLLKETRKTKKKKKKIDKKIHGPVSPSACARRGAHEKKDPSGARKVTAVKSQHAIQIYGGYTDTRCQERTRWHDATVTYTPRPGFIHHPVEMQFPLFLPEKLLGPSPRHVPQIKPATPERVHPTRRARRAAPSRWLCIVLRRECWGWHESGGILSRAT